MIASTYPLSCLASVARRAVSGRTGARARAVRAGALAALLLAARAAPARAQFSVQPVIVNLDAVEKEQTSAIRVKNEGATDMEFRVYVGDFDQAENGENLFFKAGAHPRSCSARLSVFPNIARLRPGEAQAIRLAMRPGNAGCWSMVFVETASPATPGMVRVAQRIGVKVYSTPPTYATKGDLAGVTVAAPAPDSVRVAITFRNDGQAPLRPQGKLEIRTTSGDVVASVDIEPFSALPGHLRRVVVPVGRPLAAGDYLAIPVLDFGGKDLVGDQVSFRVP